MAVADLLLAVVTKGGPYGLAAIGWLAWWYERRQNKESAQSMLELATAQIEATVKQEAALQANTKLMERFLDR